MCTVLTNTMNNSPSEKCIYIIHGHEPIRLRILVVQQCINIEKDIVVYCEYCRIYQIMQGTSIKGSLAATLTRNHTSCQFIP